MSIQTKFEFTLPRGYVDEHSNVQRKGVMRLATAMDEIAPLRDPRVRSNQAYLIILLLSRVIIKLGTLSEITPPIIEELFAADLTYLQELYRRINEQGVSDIPIACPACGAQFELDLVDLAGES